MKSLTRKDLEGALSRSEHGRCEVLRQLELMHRRVRELETACRKAMLDCRDIADTPTLAPEVARHRAESLKKTLATHPASKRASG